MQRDQRRVIAVAAYLVAAILCAFFFVRPFWTWLTWDRAQGTFDLGIVRITTRPPFPSDARSVLVGLVVPVILAAFGRVIDRGPRAGGN